MHPIVFYTSVCNNCISSTLFCMVFLASGQPKTPTTNRQTGFWSSQKSRWRRQLKITLQSRDTKQIQERKQQQQQGKKNDHADHLTLATSCHMNDVSMLLNWSTCLFQWGEAADRPNNWPNRLRPLLRFHTPQPRKMLQTDCRTSTNGSLVKPGVARQAICDLINFIYWFGSVGSINPRQIYQGSGTPPPPPPPATFLLQIHLQGRSVIH